MAKDYKPEDIMFPDQKIVTSEIVNEMKTSYIDYAMSVIVGRALPDVRDGLKPVHRRILYTMYEGGLTSDKAFKKCATAVGDVLGHYHPHGDASVYDALVRLAQNFSMRYPLIEGHGNFGLVGGLLGGDLGADVSGRDGERVLEREGDRHGLVTLAPACGGERIRGLRGGHAADVRAVHADLGVYGVRTGHVNAEARRARQQQGDHHDAHYRNTLCGVPGAPFLGRQVFALIFSFHFILGFIS